MQLIDFELTEGGDIHYNSSGDIALVTDEDALRQQVLIDVNEITNEWRGGGLNNAQLKNLQQSIKDRLNSREYSDLVTVEVVGVDRSAQKVLFEGELSTNDSWRFDIDL